VADRDALPRGSLHVKTPAPLPCGRLLPAQPAPVREALAGLRLAGNLGLGVSVTFDAAMWDALALDVNVDPLCEVTAEPTALATLLQALDEGTAPSGPAAALPLGRYHPDFVPLAKMPAHLPAAFLTAEDGRFFAHHGFDLEMIRRALAHDLEMQAFAKGGSTITQQLAKNLFLVQTRTLARKFEETVLAWRLHTRLDKKRLLELYLNVIELGPNIRGVKQAARAYFGKEIGELHPIESAHLAALTPNPYGLARRFRDGRVDDGWLQRLYDLLGMMNRSGRLSRAELAAARAGKLSLRKI
jgi:membrane peptidoglycan carboxypeptidase